MARTATWVLSLICSVTFFWACGEAEETPSTPNMEEMVPPAPSGPTWHADVAPVVERACNGCHYAGGIGPFTLETYGDFSAVAAVSLDSIEHDRMPPWLPDPTCRTYLEERILTPEEKALFAEWKAAGMPEGEPVERSESPQLADDVEPDFATAPETPYLANTALSDDYRCFVLDKTFEEDTYVRRVRTVPGDPAVVHHVLVYVIYPDDLDELAALQDSEDGLGYTCFGGPRVPEFGVPSPIAGWAPGGVPNVYQDGAMGYIPQGSRLLMQVHYNLIAADPAPDLTQLEFNVYDEPQPFVVRAKPLPHLGIQIPAGDSDSTHVREFVNFGDTDLQVVSTAPHMHVLGTKLRLDVIDPETDEETCIVDVPDWDFNWQQTFLLREPVTVPPGGRFRLTCTYDNSPGNQPRVDGERIEPRNVSWGDGTLDEMCLNFVGVLEPFKRYVTRCADVEDCRAACEGDAWGCALDCVTDHPDCSQCAVMSLTGNGGCVRNTCPVELFQASDCMIKCTIESLLGGGMGRCMQTKCPDQMTALSQCMDTPLADGVCETELERCIVR